jgi:hypothetical protein
LTSRRRRAWLGSNDAWPNPDLVYRVKRAAADIEPLTREQPTPVELLPRGSFTRRV